MKGDGDSGEHLRGLGKKGYGPSMSWGGTRDLESLASWREALGDSRLEAEDLESDKMGKR